MNSKRKTISFEQKLKILKRYKSGEKAADIGRSLGLAVTTVKTICKRDNAKISKLAQTVTPLQLKQMTKLRSSLMVKMESLLCTWIENQTSQGMPISKNLIKNEALSIYNYLKEIQPLSSRVVSKEFEASNGWFERFKTRANLNNLVSEGETASADISASEKFQIELKAIIDEGGYSSKQVLIVYETGLFWKRLPSRTYLSKTEKYRPGPKASKDRLTLLLGGNAAGDFKFKPFLINQSENPRALRNVTKTELPVYWRANKTASMTSSLFKDWMHNCAVPELQLYCFSEKIDFKVLLLIHSAPAHSLFCDEFSENIKVIFMPPNTMDQGVISTFKSYYLRRTFKQLLQATGDNDKLFMSMFWKEYNIKMAIKNISLSWEEVKTSCMNGTWRNIWPECVSKNSQDHNDITNVCKEIADLAAAAKFDGMGEEDINELLSSNEEALDNATFLPIAAGDNALADNLQASDFIPKEKKLTAAKISNAMQLIAQAMDIFAENDPDENRSSIVALTVAGALNCYKVLLEKKPDQLQQTLEQYLKKKTEKTTDFGG